MAHSHPTWTLTLCSELCSPHLSPTASVEVRREIGGPSRGAIGDSFSVDQNSKTRIAEQLREEAGPCPDYIFLFSESGDHPTMHAQKRLPGGQRGVMSVLPDVRIPEREERRCPRQCNSQKGKFITDLSQGSCRIQLSGAGSESPEPKLLPKFIGYA